MTPQLQLPSKVALHEALEPLTESLKQVARVQALYLSAIRQTPDAIYNLLIVVQEAGALTDLQQQIPVLQVQFPVVRMQVYTSKQLQQLEENGLDSESFYKDIKKMRDNIAGLVKSAMKDVVKMLEDALGKNDAERKSVVQSARTMIRNCGPWPNVAYSVSVRRPARRCCPSSTTTTSVSCRGTTRW